MPVLLLAAGALLWANWPRDSAVRTSVGDALRDYRAGAGGPMTGSRRLPRPGVYVYSIAGGESLDAALDGAHPYGGRATITIEASPCGVTERWQPLATRWSETSTCEQGGELRLASVVERREFFGSSSLDSYRCRGAVPALSEVRAGVAWAIACSGGSGSLRISSRVISTGAVEVGGRRWPAVRIRSRALVGGDNPGEVLQTDWRRRADGLLLRRSASAEVGVDALGGGTYSEVYSLELLAATPRR